MERPDDDLILEALKQLHLLNAIDDDGRVNDFGREMCKLPMEPHFAKSILVSKYLDCQEDVLVVVALLSSEKLFQHVPRGNLERFIEVQAAVQRLMLREGDHATMCRLYRDWRESGDDFARSNFLNLRSLRQARNIVGQIRDLVKSIDYRVVEQHLESDHIYRLCRSQELARLSRSERLAAALCSSFFFNAARRVHNMSEDYLLLSEGNLVALDPSSAFCVRGHFPEYIVFSELAGNAAGRLA
jgi:HrpA-like RNA helicase